MRLEEEPNNLYGDLADIREAEDKFTKEDMTKLIRLYLEETIPDKLKNETPYKEFWAILGKSPIVTFLKEEDEEIYDSLFRITKLQLLMSKPEYEYNFDMQNRMNQLRIYFKSAIKRAIGFEKNRINERTMEATHINQVMRTNTDQFDAPTKTGFIGRLAQRL